MRWSYRFHVDAPIERIYERALTKDRWFRWFGPYYREVEASTPDFPNAGSSITVRCGIGPLPMRFTFHVLEHERNHLIRVREEAFGGLWIDRGSFAFVERDGGTDVTVTTDQTSKFLPLAFLIALLWPTNWLLGPPAMRRLKAMVEGDVAAS